MAQRRRYMLRTETRETLEKARELRRRATEAERVLWDALRGRKLDGLKFRRQQPFGAYVVDFCCVSHLLVVELDGGIHDEQIAYDAERTAIIEAYGFKVLRFRNEQVLQHLPSVLEKISATAATRHPLSRAPGEGVGG